MLPDHLRQLRQFFLLDCDCQAYKLSVGPCQWSSRASALAELEPWFWRLLPVPDLLGQHASCVGHLLHGVEVRVGVSSAGKFVFAALAGEDDPEASYACALVAFAVCLFTVAIVIVAVPCGTVGRVHLDDLVHHFKRFNNQRIIGRSNAQADKLKKSSVYDLALVPGTAAIVDRNRPAFFRLAFLCDANVIL